LLKVKNYIGFDLSLSSPAMLKKV